MKNSVSTAMTLPRDGHPSTLVGRVWIPGTGPTPVTVRNGELIDISQLSPTMAGLLDSLSLLDNLSAFQGPSIGALDDWIQSTWDHGPDTNYRHLLAPNDLQVVKAAGVTFAASMVERVIEEQARGDASKAQDIRAQVTAAVGADLSTIRPGSREAMQLKEILIQQKLWSQYLEVGIGPDAEIFTKSAPMASVGTCVQVGLHPGSSWNNPEPEVVLAVTSSGQVVGAALGNDVNLRDFEGRSALLLGKAKDNNGACAIGPFIRLFDAHFSIHDVRHAVIDLVVEGVDGFLLEGSSSMSKISRDPLDLVAQAMGKHHQYPDGIMLFCGTMFAPTQDRDALGSGFTHHLDDLVSISSEKLGGLFNKVGLSDQIAPWKFGIGALMKNLAGRGLLKDKN